jgi:hypothetical protein
MQNERGKGRGGLRKASFGAQRICGAKDDALDQTWQTIQRWACSLK